MSNRGLPTKPCHNCRRQRLRCDRSYPRCNKCVRNGQECMGYGELFLWNKGIASRGKMMGKTFKDLEQGKRQTQVTYKTRINKGVSDTRTQLTVSPRDTNYTTRSFKLNPSYTLRDPLFEDLKPNSRNYLYYFAGNVCKDLVCYDVPSHNPFRDLIPMTRHHPVLFNIVTAISALHMSNASRKSCTTRSSMPSDIQNISSNNNSRNSPSSTQCLKEYRYALVAKQKALGLLRQALDDTLSANLDMILASVLLFVEFELIHSGKDDWRFHISGAKELINPLLSSSKFDLPNMSPMCSSLISNCVVYDILGSTLASSMPYEPPYTSSTQLFSALESAEANNYLSCPALLLQLVLSATELSHSISTTPTTNTTAQQISFLMLTARSFDATLWATNLQKISPHKDVKKRIHIASAHKAAVCIYISRATSLFSQAIDHGDDLETMVSDIIHHLSFVTCDDGLFKATSWPAFVAGAETRDAGRQAWAVKRLYELWDFCPWGYIQSAVDILGMIRQKRISGPNRSGESMNWVRELRSLGVNWLIA